MAITKFDKDLAIIEKLDDEPNDVGGLTPAALKGQFDEAPIALQTYLNTVLIPALEGISGAGSIGASVQSVAEKNIQGILTAFETAIANRYTKGEDAALIGTETSGLVKSVDLNMTTGVLTVTKKDGTVTSWDTALEKVPASFVLSETAEGTFLVITNVDGTTSRANLGDLVDTYTFNSGEQIAFSTTGAANNKTITATIRANSIGIDKLTLSAVSQLEGYVTSSAGNASAAATSATDAGAAKTAAETAKTAAETASNASATAKTAAETAKAAAELSASSSAADATISQNNAASAGEKATLSKSYAVGGTGSRLNEDTDNARYYKEQAAAIVGGDFATKKEAQGYANTAEKNAKDASRPTSWTPSASDVGAAPSSHVGDSTHATVEEKTAWNGKAAGTHTHLMKEVTDLTYATKAEAEAGTDEKKLMSPLRVKQAVESSSGCVLQISFVDDFSGRPYTVTAAGESYSGTVPAGLAVNVSVKNCRTTYTVEATTAAADKYSTTITTGDYFGQYPVRLVTFTATLKVATKAGAAVTAVSGGNRYTATADGTGLATLTIRQPGTYAVDAVLGGKTVSGSIAITTDGGTYNLKLPFISTILEENDWDTISQVSADGQGANYWKVGDKKKIVINGMVGKTNFQNLIIYPFILGFNHNAAVEGNGRIHWQLGKNAAGDLIALVDSKYNTNVAETGWFSMNGTNVNNGGWNGSQMCNTILGSHSVPTSPAPNTLFAALPPELRAVMKPCTKYRDNTGGGSDNASYVTATTEYLPLLSEFEYFGARTYANSAEQSHQKQYDYYKAGNSKIFHRHDTPATAVYAWSGSVYATSATNFCGVSGDGSPGRDTAYRAYAVPPSFFT